MNYDESDEPVVMITHGDTVQFKKKKGVYQAHATPPARPPCGVLEVG
jgi:hypothetical protein